MKSASPTPEATAASPDGQKQRGWFGPFIVAVLFMAIGFGGGYVAYRDFEMLEAGQVNAIRVWIPVAMVAKWGQPWYAIGKWVQVSMITLLGVWALVTYVRSLFSAYRLRAERIKTAGST